MAVPTTGPYGTATLDDFNRAGSTSPPSASWTGAFNTGNAHLALAADTATVKASTTGFDDDYWNVATFGPDCEVWCCVTALATSTDELFALYARGAGFPSSTTAYECSIAANALTTVTVARENSPASFPALGNVTLSASFAVNDALAMAVLGSGSLITIEIWFWDDSAGTGWVKAGTVTDNFSITAPGSQAPFKAAGRIALEMQNTTSRITAFGGGTIVVSSAAPSPARPLLMALNRMRPFALPLMANPGPILLSSGQSVALAVASEIDTALALAKAKVLAFSLVTETDSAITLTKKKLRALAQSTETDTTLAVGKFKIKTLLVDTETDAVITLPAKKVKAVTLASEVDSVLGFTRFKARVLGVVSEVDSAITFTGKKVKAISLASETDLALAFARVKSRLLSVVTEVDSALAFTKKKVKALGVVTETDLALAITRLISGQSAALATALESDTVQAFIRLKRKALAQTTEADTATALLARKAKAVTQVTEADTTLAVGRQKARTLAPATVVNAALVFTSRKVKAISATTDTNSAIAFVRKILSVLLDPRAAFSSTGPSASVNSTGLGATVVVEASLNAEVSEDPTGTTIGEL